ncbi:MAG: hypothetical protein ACT4PM_14880 [Gemmatimonadales bacterium]
MRVERVKGRVRLGWLVGASLLACDGRIAGPTLSDQDQFVLQIIPGLESPHLREGDDPATITAATLQGSILHLFVRYGGGCRTHRFALVAGTDFGDSDPPYTRLWLVHDANEDLCEALIERQLQVDLHPIIPLVRQMGAAALRFDLMEPGGEVSAVGELMLVIGTL